MQSFPTYKKVNFTRIFLYFLLAFSSLCLYFLGNHGEPFPLAFAYALITAGIPPIACALIGFFPSLFSGDIFIILLYLAQNFLLLVGFYLQYKIQKKAPQKIGFLPLFSLTISLALFVLLSPFQSYPIPFISSQAQTFWENPFMQKVFFAAILFLLAAIFSVALKALLHKLLKCRLRNDEIVFCALLWIFIGMGICHFLSVNAYMGIAFFILLLYACITKDATIVPCAFLLSLPPYLTARLSIERFFIYGIALWGFIRFGRLAAVCTMLLVFFAYGYIDGLFFYQTSILTQSILSIILPTLLIILLPISLIHSLENKLIFYREKHLSRIAINRNRAAIGEKLFEISAVFREIQTTFSALGNHEGEQSAKEYIRGCIMEEVCKQCPQYHVCIGNGAPMEIDKLVDIACARGRVTLIDMPRALADSCYAQSEMLNAVNRQIGDYHKYMIETENAASARALLANQAQGVSEILKNLALEQSEPLHIQADKERALNVALLTAGIICSKTFIYGEEENPTVSLITYGRTNIKRIADIISNLFLSPMMISEKISLNQDKYCCIFRKKPYYDAAFGVATTAKHGQSASGDTHSVIKIDERRFMVALSDGMGSGEYARRISESTISLLESFYRAKMPSDLVLSTINKLLTFHKEETFACVDIALINLDDGGAHIVKIGSPCGFILSNNTIKVLEGSSLPLGILDSLHPDTASYTLSENDVLLFLSDGVTDAFGSITDLYDVLKSIPANNPQQLADNILTQALQTYGGTPKDDMTALAVRLFRNETI